MCPKRKRWKSRRWKWKRKQDNKDNNEAKKLLEDNNEYYTKCIYVSNHIQNDIECKKTLKRRLDSLLKNDEDIVIKRLNLLKLIERLYF